MSGTVIVGFEDIFFKYIYDRSDFLEFNKRKREKGSNFITWIKI